MDNETLKTWQSYEEVATYLLNKFAEEFGLSGVESKQNVLGLKSGTSWEIDAKGVLHKEHAYVIVECRRYPDSKQNQEKIAGLAYRIYDTGFQGGILVSPAGLQSGAALVAEAENIVSITLHENSTPHEFEMQFLNKIFIGIRESVSVTDTLDTGLLRSCKLCGKQFSVKVDERECTICIATVS